MSPWRDNSAVSLEAQKFTSVSVGPSEGSWLSWATFWTCLTQSFTIDCISFKILESVLVCSSITSMERAARCWFCRTAPKIAGCAVVARFGIWIVCCRCWNESASSEIFFCVEATDCEVANEVSAEKYGEMPNCNSNSRYSKFCRGEDLNGSLATKIWSVHGTLSSSGPLCLRNITMEADWARSASFSVSSRSYKRNSRS
ncbi:hypothetical protein OGATHE_001863 [Ogataea polymorpha]|uniref:Uncharacterized protein n=1 Tax=Ogataea polymorpha TaxID=460523 RepID=A0A9P8PKJ4_9ASCO|nr:hypothetical protein OGATHE_001863 [Ogataea polymorpha]